MFSLDPYLGEQNVPDPTDPDPLHWWLYRVHSSGEKTLAYNRTLGHVGMFSRTFLSARWSELSARTFLRGLIICCTSRFFQRWSMEGWKEMFSSNSYLPLRRHLWRQNYIVIPLKLLFKTFYRVLCHFWIIFLFNSYFSKLLIDKVNILNAFIKHKMQVKQLLR